MELKDDCFNLPKALPRLYLDLGYVTIRRSKLYGRARLPLPKYLGMERNS
jgi:hypothetical protein